MAPFMNTNKFINFSTKDNSRENFFKEQFNNEFNYYIDGFQFFNMNLQKIEEINERIKADIIEVGENAKSKIKANEFQDAFNFTKIEYDVLMKEKLAGMP